MNARLLIGIAALTVACGAPPEPERPPTEAPGAYEPTPQDVERAAQRFRTVERGFLDWYYETHPVRATELGIHAYDARLPALDRAAIQARIDDLLDWLAQLDRVPPALLEDDRRYDYGVLEFALRSELLDLEEIRNWVADPRLYTSTIADGLSSLADREFAPVPDRVRSLVARMGAAPGLLDAARQNLRTPPRVWTELAIGETRGLARYIAEDLPAALTAQAGAPVEDPALASASEALVRALEQHAQWLESDLLPRSSGDFRLGPYIFQRKLLYDEHINLGVEELDRLNERRITEYQQEVARVAAEIDPARTPRQIMDSLVASHPEPEELIPTARDMMMDLRAWVRANDIVTLPTEEVPEVRETPPYARAGFASMDAPGPFEEQGLEAYYNITNVDPAWTEEQKRQHLTYFNYPGLLGVTIHETFPGHFVQLAYERRVSSDLRKVFTPRSFVEGWAHYAEQMVIDQGFRSGDPAVRLGQLRRALQRHARWYAGLHLHAFGASLDDVVRRFMEIAYFEEFPARREVIRGTYDPTYLYYALGRMQILELREDYRRHVEQREEQFSLREFHDRLLELGLPLTLAREALISPPRGPRLEPLMPRRRP